MHKASEFDYALPVELIAQEPLADRGASRLLVLERASGAVTHRRFADLTALIHPEDVLVLNASKVIPARLDGERVAGNAAAEPNSCSSGSARTAPGWPWDIPAANSSRGDGSCSATTARP